MIFRFSILSKKKKKIQYLSRTYLEAKRIESAARKRFESRIEIRSSGRGFKRTSTGKDDQRFTERSRERKKERKLSSEQEKDYRLY